MNKKREKSRKKHIKEKNITKNIKTELKKTHQNIKNRKHT
jgi:hypothetical protein